MEEQIAQLGAFALCPIGTTHEGTLRPVAPAASARLGRDGHNATVSVSGSPLNDPARDPVDDQSDDAVEPLSPVFDSAGLIPAIAQQWDTGEVLMLAWMDAEALSRTRATGLATYWSRSRGRYWVKGETSGHHQVVRKIRLDCDGDALLLSVDQTGPACHTGRRSCFDRGVIPLAGSLSGVDRESDHDPGVREAEPGYG